MKSQVIQKQIQKEALFLLGLVVLAFVLFWDSGLDLWAARMFYHPGEKDPWFEQYDFLWNFFYHAAPWLTGILLLGSLLVLVISQFRESFKRFRIYAVFIFLSIALGPGLVINSVFKPYWGRPRPREVIELGGKYQYRPFYIPEVGAQGKAFPCGHCSVGFTYAVFWWILHRRKKALAYVSLTGATVLGSLMGVGRIAAGGHFFSDVVWAGIFSWSVCFWLYHFVLKIPEREDGTLEESGKLSKVGEVLSRRKSFAYAVYAAMGGLTLTSLLLASPFYHEIELKGLDQGRLAQLNILIEQGNVEVLLQKDLSVPFQIEGYAKGFGFPKNKVISICEGMPSQTSCQIHKKGFFSDYESVIRVRMNPDLIENLDFKLEKGELDLSKASPLPSTYRFQALTYFK